MAYKLNPFTGLFDKIEEGKSVSFDGAITDPSGEFTGSSVQDFVNIFFQSVDPNVSLSTSPYNSLREYGDDVVNPTLNSNFTSGSNPSSPLANLVLKRGDTEIYNGRDLSFQDTFTVDTATTYSITITDDEGRTDSSNRTYSFAYPFFYGAVASGDITDGITETNLEALGKVIKEVKTKGNENVTASPNTERFVFLYPNSYGNLSSIIDNNGFETISDYNVSTISVTSMLDGTNQDYKFYELKSNTTQTDFTNQFKF